MGWIFIDPGTVLRTVRHSPPCKRKPDRGPPPKLSPGLFVIFSNLENLIFLYAPPFTTSRKFFDSSLDSPSLGDYQTYDRVSGVRFAKGDSNIAARVGTPQATPKDFRSRSDYARGWPTREDAKNSSHHQLGLRAGWDSASNSAGGYLGGATPLNWPRVG